MSVVLAILLGLSLCGCGGSKKEDKDTAAVEKAVEEQSEADQKADDSGNEQKEEQINEEPKDADDADRGPEEEDPQEETISRDNNDKDTNGEDAEDSTDSGEGTDDVDPELKAFLDSYEAFTDEYVKFMKKYNADPQNVTSMLTEYAEIMEKYESFSRDLEKYDEDEMSTADAKYYLEVTSRCAQKMLDVYAE